MNVNRNILSLVIQYKHSNVCVCVDRVLYLLYEDHRHPAESHRTLPVAVVPGGGTFRPLLMMSSPLLSVSYSKFSVSLRLSAVPDRGVHPGVLRVNGLQVPAGV